MFRVWLLSLSLMACQNLWAQECVDANGKDLLSEPEEFNLLIESAKSCYEAVQLAEACAWGSSMDAVTAGTAYGVCEKELQENKPTQKLESLLFEMQTACAEKYEGMEGTLYISMQAYCSLSAIEWVLNIASEE